MLDTAVDPFPAAAALEPDEPAEVAVTPFGPADAEAALPCPVLVAEVVELLAEAAAELPPLVLVAEVDPFEALADAELPWLSSSW